MNARTYDLIERARLYRDDPVPTAAASGCAEAEVVQALAYAKAHRTEVRAELAARTRRRKALLDAGARLRSDDIVTAAETYVGYLQHYGTKSAEMHDLLCDRLLRAVNRA